MPQARHLQLEFIEEAGHLAIFITTLVEARVRRHQHAHGFFILGESRQQ